MISFSAVYGFAHVRFDEKGRLGFVAPKRGKAHRAEGMKVDPRGIGCCSYLLDERCRAGEVAGKEQEVGAHVECDRKVTKRPRLAAEPGPPLGDRLAGLVIPQICGRHEGQWKPMQLLPRWHVGAESAQCTAQDGQARGVSPEVLRRQAIE